MSYFLLDVIIYSKATADYTQVKQKKHHSTTTKMTDELKPGQKFPTPTPGMGDRVFYETLLRQRPTSEMAQEWYES